MTALEYAQAEAARLLEERTRRNEASAAEYTRDAPERLKLHKVVDDVFNEFVSVGFKREGHSLNKDHQQVAFVEVVQTEYGPRIKWTVEGCDNQFTQFQEAFIFHFGKAMGRYL